MYNILHLHVLYYRLKIPSMFNFEVPLLNHSYPNHKILLLKKPLKVPSCVKYIAEKAPKASKY